MRGMDRISAQGCIGGRDGVDGKSTCCGGITHRGPVWLFAIVAGSVVPLHFVPDGFEPLPAGMAGQKEAAWMLARWPIRVKVAFGVGLLAAIVGILAICAFQGVYAYRQLVRSISHRAAEIPQAGQLVRHADSMRFVLSQAATLTTWTNDALFHTSLREKFRDHLRESRQCWEDYRRLLESLEPGDGHVGDIAKEEEILRRIDVALRTIEQADTNEEWLLRRTAHVELLSQAVERLRELTHQIQDHLYTRMRDLQRTVRGQYRTWIVLCWGATLGVISLLVVMGFCFHRWVFAPLQTLIDGSRRVAAGDFAHRIHLNTHDEMCELANALNAMTNRFVQIRDDLNRQVRERTKEVVRSEQLASVGFLAAGVAHEINNPIGAIALAADGLESRLEQWFSRLSAEDQPPDVETVRRYLRMIQEEAFRCKEITEGLLDFSRLGHVERQPTDLPAIVRSVIEMIQHLGKYRSKNILFHGQGSAQCIANPQEMKQVVLNLLTNALDAVDEHGKVEVEVREEEDSVVLVVADDGCGMTEEVREHLFEPFFTRRRDGQGTGLGLSITYRIIQDHGGSITAHSDGPGRGARFVVTLPKVNHGTIGERRLQAA